MGWRKRRVKFCHERIDWEKHLRELNKTNVRANGKIGFNEHFRMRPHHFTLTNVHAVGRVAAAADYNDDNGDGSGSGDGRGESNLSQRQQGTLAAVAAAAAAMVTAVAVAAMAMAAGCSEVMVSWDLRQ